MFHILLLEKNITKTRREFLVPEFEPDDDKEYKVEAIQDSAIYGKETDKHLPGLYYLVAWKGYLEEKNTWNPFLAVMHFRKTVSIFHKDYPEKSTAISASLDFTLPIAKPTIQLPVKWKQEQLKKRATKHAK